MRELCVQNSVFSNMHANPNYTPSNGNVVEPATPPETDRRLQRRHAPPRRSAVRNFVVGGASSRGCSCPVCSDTSRCPRDLRVRPPNQRRRRRRGTRFGRHRVRMIPEVSACWCWSVRGAFRSVLCPSHTPF